MTIRNKLILSIIIIAVAAALPLSYFIVDRQMKKALTDVIKIGQINSKILSRTLVDVIIKNPAEADLISAQIDSDEVLNSFSDLFSFGLVFADATRISDKNEKLHGRKLAHMINSQTFYADLNDQDEYSSFSKYIKHSNESDKLDEYRQASLDFRQVACPFSKEPCYEFFSVGQIRLNGNPIELVLARLYFSKNYIMQPARNLQQLIWLVTLTVVLAAVLLGLFLSRLISSPLARLTASATIIGEGNFDHRVDLAGKDELASLGATFNHMAEKLKLSEQRRLRQAIMEKEMEMARNIQMAMLPPDRTKGPYSFCGYMRTADDVGGDYYDSVLINTGEDAYWFIIGDVSGHGLSAGLVMLMAQTSFHTSLLLKPEISPSETMRVMNRILAANLEKLNERKFMTSVIFKADTRGNFTFAGLHLDLMIYRRAEKRVQIVPTDGIWLGLMNDITAETSEKSITLNPGDVLLLYTDGITESMNQSGELYMDRLIESFKTHCEGGSNIEDIRTYLLNDVDKFRGSSVQRDDLTLVIIEYKESRVAQAV